ncbi:MAG TPA: GNAT family protein [Actinomycetota bacterium]|nr:GNAT family protein [Actinomycetota bacterium]
MGFQAPDEHRAGDLLLRSYRPGDGPELNRATVSSYRHLRRFMPWARADTTDEHGEETARRFRAAWLLGEREWVVGVWRGAKLAAGTGFHLHGRPLDEGVADVGMWVRADEAGRGLGTRVLEAMVDWADGAWPFYRLTWGCDARNVASARVAEKCGFVLEGRLREDAPDHLDPAHRRDTLLFGLLPADPRPWRHRG